MDRETWRFRIGKAVKLLRERAEMNQAGLAVAAGLSQSAVSRIEAGRIPLTDDGVAALSDALQVRPWVIFALADSMEASKDHESLRDLADIFATIQLNPRRIKIIRALVKASTVSTGDIGRGAKAMLAAVAVGVTCDP